MRTLAPGWQRGAAIALAVVAVVGPPLAPNDYWIGVMARICLYATLALGLNIVVGFAGLLDLGYVAFFGIGSYVYAFLASPHFGLHLPFPLAVLVTTLATALSGILIGGPTLRLRGDYLAIVTLGFGEITYLLLINLDRPVNITGGPSGIIGIDAPVLAGFTLSRNTEYYYLFLAALALTLLASARLRHSRVGWAWQAIREDELAARAMGIASEFRAKTLAAQARRWTTDELTTALHGLVELDAMVKGAPGSEMDAAQRRLAFTLWARDPAGSGTGVDPG